MAQPKQRSAWILLKVTDEEKRKFKKLAESRHTTLSEVIRQVLHREADLEGRAA